MTLSPVTDIQALMRAQRSGEPVAALWESLRTSYGEQGTRDLLWLAACTKTLSEPKADVIYNAVLAQLRLERAAGA